MTAKLLLSAAAFALLLTAGCSTFNDAELAQIRATGVRPELVTKLERDHPLEPEEYVELKRARVPDQLILKQLDEVDLDYIVTGDDVRQMQRGGVSPVVIDRVLRRSREFAADHAGSRYDSFAYDDGYGPFYGDVGVGVGFGY